MCSENREKKLKICHVITRMIVGGAQENTLYSVIGHLRHGHEAVLLTGPSPGREGKLLAHVDCPEFETVEIPSLVRNIDPVNDIKAYFALKRFFRNRRFDVVHTHSSKAGIIGLTKSVARELAGKGITCNAIAPGFIRTDMTKEIEEDNPLLSSIPLGRMGEAEDIASAAAFLVTSPYITGEVIRVDGGLAM